MDLNKSLILAHKLLTTGRIEQAENKLKQIVIIDPKNIFALNNLGNINFSKKKYNQSLIFFNKCLEINPFFYQALINKGSCLQEMGDYLEAENCYKKSLKLNSNFVEAYQNLGNCLIKQNKFNEAIINFNKILKAKPDYCEAFFNKGICFERLEKYKDAIVNFREAINIKEDFVEAYNRQGNCLQKLHLYDDAINCYKKAIKIRPNYINANNNLGHLQLLLGNYEDGWQNYEWRKKIGNNYFESKKKNEWNGKQSLKNKTIFISNEQGFGDYIQFCRYLPFVKKLGAQLILNPPKELSPLINSMKLDYINTDQKKDNKIKFDYYCSIGSLPLAFKSSINNIPNKTPYISVDQKKIIFWGKKINKDKKNIGIKWTGNKSHWNDKNRSTELNKIKSLFEISCEFHSLEIEYSKDDLVMKNNIKNLHCYKDELIDFEDTAALIENMDLIITVDTSVAHLCGALNKNAWIMLPDLPDFRWLLNRNDSPWYPSLKLYRQEKQGNWNNVIKNIIKDLNN